MFYIINKDKTVLNTSQDEIYCSAKIKIAKFDSEDTLRQKRLFKFSHCALSIYI